MLIPLYVRSIVLRFNVTENSDDGRRLSSLLHLYSHWSSPSLFLLENNGVEISAVTRSLVQILGSADHVYRGSFVGTGTADKNKYWYRWILSNECTRCDHEAWLPECTCVATWICVGSFQSAFDWRFQSPHLHERNLQKKEHSMHCHNAWVDRQHLSSASPHRSLVKTSSTRYKHDSFDVGVVKKPPRTPHLPFQPVLMTVKNTRSIWSDHRR